MLNSKEISISSPPRTGTLSLDARVLLGPAAAYSSLDTSGTIRWLAALRRPLFLTIVLAAMVSLIAVNQLTLRLAISAVFSWSFVPLFECAGLALVLMPRKVRPTFPLLLDYYFAGHAAWILILIVVAGTLAFVTPQTGWVLLTGPFLIVAVITMLWSGYIDFCFFRFVVGARGLSAILDIVIFRLFVWWLVFWIFAVPKLNPWAVVHELADAFAELTR